MQTSGGLCSFLRAGTMLQRILVGALPLALKPAHLTAPGPAAAQPRMRGTGRQMNLRSMRVSFAARCPTHSGPRRRSPKLETEAVAAGATQAAVQRVEVVVGSQAGRDSVGGLPLRRFQKTPTSKEHVGETVFLPQTPCQCGK